MKTSSMKNFCNLKNECLTFHQKYLPTQKRIDKGKDLPVTLLSKYQVESSIGILVLL